MSENFTFEEQKVQGYNQFRQDTKIPFLIRTLIKSGLVKNEKQAHKVLMILVVFIIVISLALVFWSYQPTTIKTINIKS